MLNVQRIYRYMSLVSCLTSLLALAAAQVPGQAKQFQVPADMDARLRLYLQKEMGPPDTDMRYAGALVDGADVQKKEVVVYLTGGDVCGTGGCNLLVLTVEGKSFREIGNLPTVRRPIRALQTESEGRRDIGTWSQCCSERGFEGLIRFNGHRYEKYSRGKREIEVLAGTPGEILIPKDEEGRPVFGGN